MIIPIFNACWCDLLNLYVLFYKNKKSENYTKTSLLSLNNNAFNTKTIRINIVHIFFDEWKLCILDKLLNFVSSSHLEFRRSCSSWLNNLHTFYNWMLALCHSTICRVAISCYLDRALGDMSLIHPKSFTFIICTEPPKTNQSISIWQWMDQHFANLYVS
jgi:hypothetical protein